MKTRDLTFTALLLAICVSFQTLKSLSVYITGPAVNAVLILATLYVNVYSGLFIACVAPIVAYLLGATPIVNIIPAMLPAIAIGNALIVICVNKLKNKLPLALITGSIAKALFLFLAVWFVVLPLFGKAAPAKLVQTAKVTFSITQLITALMGSGIAYVVYSTLKRKPNS